MHNLIFIWTLLYKITGGLIFVIEVSRCVVFVSFSTHALIFFIIRYRRCWELRQVTVWYPKWSMHTENKGTSQKCAFKRIWLYISMAYLYTFKTRRHSFQATVPSLVALINRNRSTFFFVSRSKVSLNHNPWHWCSFVRIFLVYDSYIC